MRPDTYEEDQEAREAEARREAEETPTDEAPTDEVEDTSVEDTSKERSLPVEEAPPTRAEPPPEPEPEPTAYQPPEPEAPPEPEPTAYQPPEPEAPPEPERTAYQPPVAEAAPSADAPTAVGVAPVEGARWPQDTAPEFEQRWQAVLLQFVDDPLAATRAAQELASEVVDQFAAALTVQKRELDAWSETGDEDTERLRTAVRGYRALLDRMLRT
jgi:hypothetical protein